MKMILVDVKDIDINIVDVDGLDDYYKYIGCRCIDIVRRKIGNLEVEIICDDEGLLVDNPIISAISTSGEPMLCGNLLIASGRVVDGELTELLPNEMHYIADNLRIFLTSEGEPYIALCNVNY